MIINLAGNKAEFEMLVRTYIKREGIENLLEWLEKTDFYTAPATTQYQLSVEGGLCQHSLSTFYRMRQLAETYYEVPSDQEDVVYNGDTIDAEYAFDIESIAIVALLHSIYKTNCYVKDFRNVKIDGRWEQREYWRWDEDFVYGRGVKSVYIIQQFMRLQVDEAQAIRFHTAGKENIFAGLVDDSYYRVYEKSPLAVLLHLAEQMAYWLDGTKV